MGLIESLALIVGTVAGAMALPFVMERLERGLDDPQPHQRRRHRLRISRHTPRIGLTLARHRLPTAHRATSAGSGPR